MFPLRASRVAVAGRFFVRGFDCPGYVRSREEKAGVWPPQYTKAEFEFADGTQVAYVNVRRLGRVGLLQVDKWPILAA